MTYIENIFICMLAPLIVAMLCVDSKKRVLYWQIFAGMGTCLLSAYINTFITGIYHSDMITATHELTPVVEEIMKLLPLLFYLIVFEPKYTDAKNAIIVIAVSFATFENICYLTQNGANNFFCLLVRGFGTGAMHIVCGAIVGYGLVYVWNRPWLKVAGTFGLLCTAVTYHATYNLLLGAGDILQTVAYVFPVITVIINLLLKRVVKHKI